MDSNTTALLQRFDAATTKIAARIRSLTDELANTGTPPDVIAAFNAEAAKLEGMGADPNNPIPNGSTTQPA